MLFEAITKLANSDWIRRETVKLGVNSPLISRCVAGADIQDAADLMTTFVSRGQLLALNSIETVPQNRNQVDLQVENYLQIIDAVQELGIATQTELVINPEQLGAGLFDNGERLALENARSICRHATNLGVLVTCDSGSEVLLEKTLQITNQLRLDFPKIGSAVYVTDPDAEAYCRELAKIPGARVRVGKTSLEAPTNQNWKSHHAEDVRLAKCLAILFESEVYPMVASHDTRIIQITQSLAKRYGKMAADFEFQMLHGVRSLEHQRLVDTGYQCRVRLAFGSSWVRYFIARLVATPDDLRTYLAALLGRN